MLSTSPCSRTGAHLHHSASPAHEHRAGEPQAAGDDLRHRYAAGDPGAIRPMYDRYGGPMLTAALHLLGGDRRLAEEAVQVAMVKAWRAASTYDPVRPLAPWLYAIVRRCAIDIGRQEQRHQVVPLDTAVDQWLSDGHDGFESAATAWAVREALGLLTAKEYAVLRLFYFDGLTQVEIAERLDVPVGTVKSRSASAHRRLRAELGSGYALAG